MSKDAFDGLVSPGDTHVPIEIAAHYADVAHEAIKWAKRYKRLNWTLLVLVCLLVPLLVVQNVVLAKQRSLLADALAIAKKCSDQRDEALKAQADTMKAFQTEEKAFNDVARLDAIDQRNLRTCLSLLESDKRTFRQLEASCASVPAFRPDLENHEKVPAGVAFQHARLGPGLGTPSAIVLTNGAGAVIVDQHRLVLNQDPRH